MTKAHMLLILALFILVAGTFAMMVMGEMAEQKRQRRIRVLQLELLDQWRDECDRENYINGS